MYTPNPKYWWEQAAACDEVAAVLSRSARGSMAVRKELFNQCHGSLERALKAILAQQGGLTDSLSTTHSLKDLCLAAGVYGELDPLQKDFLYGFTGMHVAATYPEENWGEQAWSSDVMVGIMLTRYKELRELLGGYRNAEGEEGGADGGN